MPTRSGDYSLRRRLLVALLGAVVAAGGLAAAAVYWRAFHEAGGLLDYQLQQMARSLRDHALGAAGTGGAVVQSGDFDVAVEIRSGDGLRLFYSRSRVTLPDAAPGHTTLETTHGPWRVFTLQQEGLTVRVAQPASVRDHLATQAAWRTLAPFLLLVPMLGVFVWLVVTRALKPLDTLAEAVSHRNPASLEPLPQAGLPQEMRPVVSELNDLLGRLDRALQTQRSFVADAAHELRTPLAALYLQAQLVQRAESESERADAVASLRHGISRATRIVEQLLLLARQEPGAAAPLAIEEVDLTDLAGDVVAAHERLAREKGVSVRLDRREHPLVVRGERESLRALVSNLVDNAVRYSPRDGCVTVAVLRNAAGIGLEVADEGPGIPPEDRARVFDRFYRRDRGSIEGSGLGLAIVRSIAERHHAEVSMDDGPHGRGTTARVVFPFPE